MYYVRKHPLLRAETHIRHAGDSAGSRCKDSFQHLGALQRGLHAGHLHPRYWADAERRGPEDGQLHGPGDVKIQGKKRKYRIRHPVLPQNFPVWVLLGSKQKDAKFRQTKLNKKKEKTPDFHGNQEIFGRSGGT